MKLHTNTTEGTRGLIFKERTYIVRFRLELTEQETLLLRSDPNLFALSLMQVRGTLGEETVTVGDCVKGSLQIFKDVGVAIQFEEELKECCAEVHARLEGLRQIRGGPRVTEFS